ncbi:MAG: alcohol dehydrogenase catalytic domain-containing protein [Anaerolineae bacterium]
MSYQRILMQAYGDPDVLTLVEEPMLPVPKPGEVRIKMLATSACFTDTLIRRGRYMGVKERLPFSPGYDLVGQIDAVGEGVTHLRVGQRVAALTVTGAYAEYVCLPADECVLVPDSLDPAEAVSMVLTYVTAYQMLHRLAKAQRGQRILVHGASGAVGSALLQLGKLLELEVFGTVSFDKVEQVRRLGATQSTIGRKILSPVLAV